MLQIQQKQAKENKRACAYMVIQVIGYGVVFALCLYAGYLAIVKH